MKTSGTCPKCAGAVHVITLDWGRRIGATIPVGMFQSADLDHYVCAQCGFVESYVKAEEAREKIAKNFPMAKRVTPI